MRNPDKDGEYFTVVFKKDIRTVEGNPMMLDTPFGKVVGIAVGDWLKYADQLETALSDVEYRP